MFKLSKKSKPVSMLTSNGKDSTGVWKERWVVLQGTKLLIYHKRKVGNSVAHWLCRYYHGQGYETHHKAILE